MTVKTRHEAPNDEEVSEPLGLGWSVQLSRHSDGALVRVRQRDSTALELTDPHHLRRPRLARTWALARARGPTHEIRARCEEFSIEASRSIEMRSGGHIVQSATGVAEVEGKAVSVRARSGDVRLKANDDVQLKGELILLNCERPQQPAAAPERSTAAVVPRTAISGDETLASTIVD